MSNKLTAKLLATAIALALSPVPWVATSTPAAAQASINVSFGYFYDRLSPYGRWFHHARWGDVWMPTNVDRDFRPYNRHGHWVYTDRGWLWVSDYPFGNIVFHYGRWVYDPDYGWLWVPGYVWGPSWVIWRTGGSYVGWFPMPPDDAYLAGEEIYPAAWNNWDRAYGYLDWYGPSYGPNWAMSQWSFVSDQYFAAPDYWDYIVPAARISVVFGGTRDTTNYAVVNNYVVNRSIDPAPIERASGRHFAAIAARNAIGGNAPIDPVSTGRQVQASETRNHGGDPRAPANARAVPLNAAAAARGGRNAFANQPGAAGPGRAFNGPGAVAPNVAGAGAGPAFRGGPRAQAQAGPPTAAFRGGPRAQAQAGPPPAAFRGGPRAQAQAGPPPAAIRGGGPRAQAQAGPPAAAFRGGGGPRAQAQAGPPPAAFRGGAPPQAAAPPQPRIALGGGPRGGGGGPAHGGGGGGPPHGGGGGPPPQAAPQAAPPPAGGGGPPGKGGGGGGNGHKK